MNPLALLIFELMKWPGGSLNNNITNRHLWMLVILLLPPALLINLGLAPFSSDEPIRVTVAMEMILSGQYFFPTLAGLPYYNKLPLFNWIVAALFQLSGSWHEVVPRLYNVCVLLIYAGVIYLAFRKQLGKQVASLTALALVTTGDILFWDSLLGLIDITFSLLMFMMFMAIFAAASKPRPGVYYLAAYLLASLGFMMKGLPSLVFLGLTWIALAISIRSWKPLLRLNHLYGIFLFLLILGAYALVYSRYNDPGMYLSIIWRESSQRTVMNHGWWNTFSHLFTFPFTIGYHFLPWTLWLVVFTLSSARKYVKEQSLLRFLLLTLGINIVLYWTSPEMHPRYLLMLLPLGLALIMGPMLSLKPLNERLLKFLLITGRIFALMALLSIPSLYLYFIYYQDFTPSPWLFSLLIPALFLIFLFRKQDIFRTGILIALSVLIIRIAFNLTVLPQREMHNQDLALKEAAEEVARATQGKTLYLAWNTQIHELTLAYFTRERREILARHHPEHVPGTWYVSDAPMLGKMDRKRIPYEVIQTFPTRYYSKPVTLYLVQIQP